jgi:hypothetical protein
MSLVHVCMLFETPVLGGVSSSFYGAGGIPPSALQPFEAYCAKPRFSSPPPSSSEARHVRRRERPLSAKQGILGEKRPVKFSLTMRLSRHCMVL